ncbi:hypothetical protein STRDD11_02634 [Streptococcus sp. DD11]|nr:hypothetical protein STRDD11_02634 [Streptococcus sp. DD11]
MLDGVDDLSNSTSLVGKAGNYLGKMGIIGSVASGVSTYLDRKDKCVMKSPCRMRQSIQG